MSIDCYYVRSHPDIETKKEEFLDMIEEEEDITWLEEIPVQDVFIALKKAFPGITKNDSDTDYFWCSDLTSYKDDIVEQYGYIPKSPWPDHDGEGFELSFYTNYAHFSGAGTSDAVLNKVDEVFKGFKCIQIS